MIALEICQKQKMIYQVENHQFSRQVADYLVRMHTKINKNSPANQRKILEDFSIVM